MEQMDRENTKRNEWKRTQAQGVQIAETGTAQNYLLKIYSKKNLTCVADVSKIGRKMVKQ